MAAHLEPEILLVDEVLAVGDYNFQDRCLRHIAKMMDRCAVIMVSHNSYLIRSNCQKVLFLDNGQAKFWGQSAEGVDEYTNYMIRQRLSKNNSLINESKYDPKVALKSFEVFDKNYREITELFAGETMIIECIFALTKPICDVIIGVSFKLDGIEKSFFCFSSQVGGGGEYYDLTEGEHKFRITIPKIALKAGMYRLGVVVSEKIHLAQHAWNSDKYILVKNPHPEFGLYNMELRFDMDTERA